MVRVEVNQLQMIWIVERLLQKRIKYVCHSHYKKLINYCHNDAFPCLLRSKICTIEALKVSDIKFTVAWQSMSKTVIDCERKCFLTALN